MDVVWFLIGLVMALWWMVARVRRAWSDRRIMRVFNDKLQRGQGPRPKRDSTKDWML